jgi:hypothetical protein
MITAQSNLDALLTAMKFDGDIDLSKESRNLLYQISEEGDLELWFASFNLDTSDIEAFVVADMKGNFSYYDLSTDALIIDNVVVATNRNSDQIDAVDAEYQIDGSGPNRQPKPGHIKAMLDVLHKMAAE